MSRNDPLRQLEFVTQTMEHRGLSSTTRTCGKPACPCHADTARRHGSNLCFTWRANGKAQALYVPPERAEEAKTAQQAWARCWEIGLRLAALNREQRKNRWNRDKAKLARKRPAWLRHGACNRASATD